MKLQGIISGIKRHAVHDGDGLRTTVFFKGCPLKCVWCHNPESLSFRREVGFYADKCVACRSCVQVCPTGSIRMESLPVTDRGVCQGCGVCAEACPTGARVCYGEIWEPEPLADKLLADKPFFDRSGGGVTLSGGECLAQPEFAAALAKALHQKGVSVFIDTCGFVSRDALDAVIPYTDTFLYDVKAIEPSVHKCCTGQDNAVILENLRYLLSQNCRVEIRYPYVPGWNDGECSKIGEFLAPLSIPKVKVLGYHGFAGSKYAALDMENTLPDVTVTAEDVDGAVEILKTYGLNAVNGMRDD